MHTAVKFGAVELDVTFEDTLACSNIPETTYLGRFFFFLFGSTQSDALVSTEGEGVYYEEVVSDSG